MVSLADSHSSLSEAVAVVSETLGEAMDDEGEPLIITSSKIDRETGRYDLSMKQTPRFLLPEVRKLLENIPGR